MDAELSEGDIPVLELGRTPLWSAITVGCVGLMLAQPCAGQCQYEVTVIQAPSCGFTGPPVTVGTALNSHSHVVGYQFQCEDPVSDKAFLWTPEEGYQLLPLPPGAFSMRASDINDEQIIVGTLSMSGLGDRGFVYDPKTQEYTILQPAFPDIGWSRANAVTDAGMVAGRRSITDDGINPYNAFFWSPEEGFTDLGVMEAPFSSANDISQSGVVVGWTGTALNSLGFVWEEGELTILDPFPGGYTSSVKAVNPNGSLRVGVGRIEAPGLPIIRAFVLDGAEMVDLGALPRFDSASASDANDAGQICGGSWITDEGGRRGVLWQSGEIFDLNELANAAPGTFLDGAVAMNNQGQMISGGQDASGYVVALLLTPMDRPEGDITIDCRVDTKDLALLLSEWGPGESIADLNSDGTVGLIDLLIVLMNWA